MSSRALRNLLILLATLAALYAILTLAPPADPDTPSGPVAEALESLRTEDFARVEILGPDGESLILERSDDGWAVNGLRADSAAVERLLAAPGAARLGDRVSANPANHSRLGISSEAAWRVAFSPVGGDETPILLGKTGLSFNSAYVRLPDQDDVYLMTGDLRGAAARPLNEWRDKLIAQVDTAAIDAIHLERNGESYSISRADSAWTLIRPDSLSDPAAMDSPADRAAVGDLLSELADLRATGFFDQELAESPDASEQVVLRLVALGAASDTLLELDAAEREAVFQIRAIGDTTLFQLPSWRIDRLIPPPERLEPAGEPESEPSN